MRTNFIQDCVEGRAKPEDIDDYINAWHIGDTVNYGVFSLDTSLIEFLGMTFEEYASWVDDDKQLINIINKYKTKYLNT